MAALQCDLVALWCKRTGGMSETAVQSSSKPDHIFLACRLQHLPGALEARPQHEAVPGPHSTGLAAVLGNHRDAGQDVAELPLVIDDAPFAGRRLPDACIEAAVALLRIPGAEFRVARDHAVRGRRAGLRLDALCIHGKESRHS